MLKKSFLYSIFVVVFFSSCVTSLDLNYLRKPSDFIPNYSDTVKFADYRLQKGDYLDIRVYSLKKEDISLYNCVGNLTQSIPDAPVARLCLYFIDEEGNIDYPYIGKINVLGKTTRELKFQLEEIFVKDIAKYVSVDVNLSNRTFSIIGESGSKRIQMPHDKVTIFQALAMVGDLSTYSDRSNVKLVRNTEKGTVVKQFDLRTEKIIDSEYYYIQPNDVLYIQYSYQKHFGIAHITNLISVTLSTTSFGMLIYKLIKK